MLTIPTESNFAPTSYLRATITRIKSITATNAGKKNLRNYPKPLSGEYSPNNPSIC